MTCGAGYQEVKSNQPLLSPGCTACAPTCTACPRGSFKDSLDSSPCRQCSDGMTTDSESSSSEQDCRCDESKGYFQQTNNENSSVMSWVCRQGIKQSDAKAISTSVSTTIGVVIGANVAVAVGTAVASSFSAAVGGSMSGAAASGMGGSGAGTLAAESSGSSGTIELISQAQYLNLYGGVGGSPGFRTYCDGFGWVNGDVGLVGGTGEPVEATKRSLHNSSSQSATENQCSFDQTLEVLLTCLLFLALVSFIRAVALLTFKACIKDAHHPPDLTFPSWEVTELSHVRQKEAHL